MGMEGTKRVMTMTMLINTSSTHHFRSKINPSCRPAIILGEGNYHCPHEAET